MVALASDTNWGCSMFGTVARMRVKKGMESSLEELSRNFESRNVPGWQWTTIYRATGDPQEYWIAVVFRDEASYKKNADDPEQNRWFGELMKMLESEPEWHDGNVVHTAHTH
jgi:quinol monooxygenase YgiN